MRLSCILLAALLVLAATTRTSAIEFRLDNYAFSSTTLAGRLLFQDSAGSAWSTFSYTGFTAAKANEVCRFLGFSSITYASYSSTTSTSTLWPVGASSTSWSCSVSLPQNPLPNDFNSYCTKTSASTGSSVLYIYCSGLRNGGNIGYQDGLTSTSYVGTNYLRWSGLDKILEVRTAHSTTWNSICTTGMTLGNTNTAASICAWAGFDSGYFQSASSTTTSALYSSVSCSTASAASLTSGCSLTVAATTCSTSSRLSVICRDATYGAVVGDYFVKLSSTSSSGGYLQIHPASFGFSSTWGVGCMSSSTVVDTTTAQKFCAWLGLKAEGATGITYYSSVSSATKIYIANPVIQSGASDFDNRSSSIATWIDLSDNTNDVPCTTSSVVAIKCGVTSSSGSGSGVPDNIGLIIGASVGGVIGFVILIVVIVVVAASSASKVARGTVVIDLSSTATTRQHNNNRDSSNSNFNNNTNPSFVAGGIPVAGAPSQFGGGPAPWQQAQTFNHPTNSSFAGTGTFNNAAPYPFPQNPQVPPPMFAPAPPTGYPYPPQQQPQFWGPPSQPAPNFAFGEHAQPAPAPPPPGYAGSY